MKRDVLITWRFGDEDLLLIRAPLPLNENRKSTSFFSLNFHGIPNLCRRGVDVLPSSDSPSVSKYPELSWTLSHLPLIKYLLTTVVAVYFLVY